MEGGTRKEVKLGNQNWRMKLDFRKLHQGLQFFGGLLVDPDLHALLHYCRID